MIREYSGEQLYVGAIGFIRELKKGVPFAESSPMLNDISCLPSWAKVSPMPKAQDSSRCAVPS